MSQSTKLAEGKTKIIYLDPEAPHEVRIFSKDDITAGDGVKRDLLPGKGALATRTTCNCFQLLEEYDISTHFLERVDDVTFRAQQVAMVPVELVARRIATGSYLKRNPNISEGYRFEDLELECFLKDDARHDPLILIDVVAYRIHLFDPKLPLKQGYLGSEDPDWLDELAPEVDEMGHLLQNTFEALEEAWAQQGVTLVDLKIECGWSPGKELVVADVIDNDSWRIWPGGQKERMVDKQVYRNLLETTPEALHDVLVKYAWVADATDKFVDSEYEGAEDNK